MFFLANTGMFNISLVSVVHLIMPSPTLDSAFELSGEKKKDKWSPQTNSGGVT